MAGTTVSESPAKASQGTARSRSRQTSSTAQD